MDFTCILLLILGLLIGGIIGLWSARNDDEPVVVVEEEKTTPVPSAQKDKKETTKEKEEDVIQLGGEGDSGGKNKGNQGKSTSS